MTLKQYIENLNEFVEKNPEALEFEVIYSEDDEGNGYNRIAYAPSKGVLDEDGEFWSETNLSEGEFEFSDMNVVCIN
jgi:hypothetical protein